MEALRDVTLSIKKGSIYGLLGSNGAGKTTLLKIIAGIYKQDHGKIAIDGEEVFENVGLKERLIFYARFSLFFLKQRLSN